MDYYYKVTYSKEALEDLISIYNYIDIKLKARTNAINQTNAIKSKINSLKIMPERYKKVSWEPWASMDMRSFAVDNFTIFYLVEKDIRELTIVRIFYSGINIKAIIN